MRGTPQESDFWAKLNYDENGDIVEWHPLLAHSADVAAMTEALLKHTILSNRLASLIGWNELTDIHIARLSALAALHDAGKVNHGFQNRGFSSDGPRGGHVGPIVELLTADYKYQKQLLIPLGIENILKWFSSDDVCIHFLLATWGHHGKPVIPQHNFKSTLWIPNDKRNPVAKLQDLSEAVKQWFPPAFDKNVKPFPNKPILQHGFNGLLTLADWLGSDPKFFGFADLNENYMENARKNAAHVIDKLVLNPEKARRKLGVEPIKFDRIADFQPYDIQQQCLDLPIYKKGSLTVLESDTGSGKTEAAIARFIRLYQEERVDGMYFAVPTRSAATQLYNRVVKAIKKAFPNDKSRPPVVQAVSGYIKVDATEGKSLPDFKVRWPDDRQDLLRERGWAAEHPKRYLAGAIVVGTIDQVFLSSLQVNHAHMRSAALLRHFLVVDEVHASDVYMTKLLDRVLDFHLSAGGHALLMSATLGISSRYRLSTHGNKLPPEPKEAKEIDYPLLTHVDASRKNPIEFHAASSGKQKKVNPVLNNIADHPRKIAQLASKQAQKGARVLIIRNLVDDCIKTQKALEEQLGCNSDLLFKIHNTPAPHHSRFAPEDRKRLDEGIEMAFGKKSDNSPVIAVATQTVEQSLDIDADLLITDLCPMDVLLQRIGRLHRHNRDRPDGFEIAQCIVLTPEGRDLSNCINNEGQASKGKHGLGTVYQDLRVLEATWRILEDKKMTYWQIPQHNRELVERATHPDILQTITEELGEGWEIHQEFIAGQEFADKQIAGLNGIKFNEPFGKNGFAQELKQVKTRLGRNDYQVFLPKPLEGPFGETIEEFTITEWQLDTIPEEFELKKDDIKISKEGFSFKYYGEIFQYNRFGLSRKN